MKGERLDTLKPCVTNSPRGAEYLAVSTISQADAPLRHVTPSAVASLPASMIQIWSLPCSDTRDLSMETSDDADGDKALMRLEMALCMPAGTEGDAKQLAWCPRGGRLSASAGATNGDEEPQPAKGKGKAGAKGKAKGKGKGKARADDAAMDVDQEGDADRASDESKLGILAGAFSDGSVSIFAVPLPDQVRKAAGLSPDEVVYGALHHLRHCASSLILPPCATVKAKPLLKLKLPETTITSLAWGGSEVVAAGCMNGACCASMPSGCAKLTRWCRNRKYRRLAGRRRLTERTAAWFVFGPRHTARASG